MNNATAEADSKAVLALEMLPSSQESSIRLLAEAVRALATAVDQIEWQLRRT